MNTLRQIASAVALALVGLSADAANAPVSVKIISFNDYHGNLESPGTFGVNTLVPPGERPPVGGAEYLAGYVASMKASNPNTVVVGAGDFIGATPLISALFYDEPAVETLNKIGVDLAAVGNHEFDKGKAELLRLQNGGCKMVGGVQDPNSCRGYGSVAEGTFDGAKFRYLAANVIDKATGKPLLAPYVIKEFQGIKVAFIGMTLRGTAGIVTPTGVAGLAFRDEVYTVNHLMPELIAQGAKAVVVVVHQGGFQNVLPGANPNLITSDINGCTGDLRNADGTDSEIRSIVKRLGNKVDLVISGHTHSAYNCSANTIDVVGTTKDNAVTTPRPTGLPNKVGRLVPVVSASAFGRLLTEIDIQLNPVTGNVVSISPVNRLIDRTNAGITPDAATKTVVDAYKTAVAPLANKVIATITAAMTNTAAASGEMEAGDLIADAQLMATQPATLGGAQIAFMNAGGVRSPGFISGTGVYPYDLTYGNAFTVQPFGNSLVTLTLNAQQLKDVLEQQFSGCLGQTANRVMQISNGFSYQWDSAGSCGTRITTVRFQPLDLVTDPAHPTATGPAEDIVVNGVVQNPSKTYRLTVNNFMATGGDGFGIFKSGLNQLGGAQDIDALVSYLTAFNAPAAPYVPSDVLLNKPRIAKLP